MWDSWDRTWPRVRIGGGSSGVPLEGTSRFKLRPEGWVGTMVEEKVSGQGAMCVKPMRWESVWNI